MGVIAVVCMLAPVIVSFFKADSGVEIFAPGAV